MFLITANESSSWHTPSKSCPWGQVWVVLFPRSKQTTIFHLDTKWPCPSHYGVDPISPCRFCHSHIPPRYLGATQWHMAVYICCQRPVSCGSDPGRIHYFPGSATLSPRPNSQSNVHSIFPSHPHDSHIKCTLGELGTST